MRRRRWLGLAPWPAPPTLQRVVRRATAGKRGPMAGSALGGVTGFRIQLQPRLNISCGASKIPLLLRRDIPWTR